MARLLAVLPLSYRHAPITRSCGARDTSLGLCAQIMESNPRFAHKVTYKLSYCVRIVAAAGVKEVTCASHDDAARVDLTASPPTVSLSEEGEVYSFA